MSNIFVTQYQKQLAEDKRKAKWFIAELVKKGIPRSAVVTNDFDSNPIPRVYITIPYGRPHGGKNKGYQRWNPTTVKQAVSWFRNPRRG